MFDPKRYYAETERRQMGSRLTPEDLRRMFREILANAGLVPREERDAL
jgi:hypothetical protein